MREKLSMKLVVDDGLCLACGACVGVCAFNALTLSNRRLVVAEEACQACHLCEKVCPVGALMMVESPAAEGVR